MENQQRKLEENSILMANAQLGLWTNIMLHQLKQYLPGASLLLNEISELLEKSEVPEELLKMIKGLDDNYQKIYSIVNSFRERMYPAHNISVRSIEGSYFNNVENILPLSYLKTGFSPDIHTKNNLPDNFYFFSEIFYIEHVLMNLIKNAAEAIEEKQRKIKGFKGKITISIEYLDPSDEIKFSVEDNGPGFSEKTDSDSVKPFHSTKDGNIRGLGLYICKMFVEILGGNITIAPKEVGSKTFFHIPAQRKGEDNEM